MYVVMFQDGRARVFTSFPDADNQANRSLTSYHIQVDDGFGNTISKGCLQRRLARKKAAEKKRSEMQNTVKKKRNKKER